MMDDGIWRRLRIVPWLVKFEGEQREQPPVRQAQVRSRGYSRVARPRMLPVDGRRAHGTGGDHAIMHATEEFAAQQDHITPFLDEVCDTSDPEALALADVLFKARLACNARRY